jgi:hypothetical protein
MTQNPLYNTGGVPDFVEPTSEQEARVRITELNLAIASINDQIAYYQAANALDPIWFRKASTSRRFKTFECERLKNWLDLHSNIADCIVSLVQSDYSEEDWAQILDEAKKLLVVRGGGA